MKKTSLFGAASEIYSAIAEDYENGAQFIGAEVALAVAPEWKFRVSRVESGICPNDDGFLYELVVGTDSEALSESFCCISMQQEETACVRKIYDTLRGVIKTFDASVMDAAEAEAWRAKLVWDSPATEALVEVHAAEAGDILTIGKLRRTLGSHAAIKELLRWHADGEQIREGELVIMPGVFDYRYWDREWLRSVVESAGSRDDTDTLLDDILEDCHSEIYDAIEKATNGSVWDAVFDVVYDYLESRGLTEDAAG